MMHPVPARRICPPDGPEVRHMGLLRLGGILHLVAQPPADLGRRLALHIPGDMGIDVQGSGRRYMAQHGGEGLHIHAAL